MSIARYLIELRGKFTFSFTISRIW